MQSRKLFYYSFIFFILALALYLPGYFGESMVMWDESRQANSALEMYLSNNYVQPTFDYQPETWCTKPHLLVVIQALFMHLLGPCLEAVRLPSLLFSAGISAMVFFQMNKLNSKYFYSASFFAFLFPLTGFNSEHLARTGDYDAPFIFFTTLYFFYIVRFLTTDNRKFIYYACYTFLGAFMFKSFASLFFILPALIAIIILKKYGVFKSKKVWLHFSIVTISICLYYLLREMKQPGYIHLTLQNEGIGRFNSVQESHQHTYLFYWNELSNRYTPVLIELYVLLSFLNLLWVKNRFLLFNNLFFLIFMVGISLSQTKIHWYAGPLIPLVLIGILCFPYIPYFSQFKWKFYFIPLALVLFTIHNFEQIKNSEMGGKWHPQVHIPDIYHGLEISINHENLQAKTKNYWFSLSNAPFELWEKKLQQYKHHHWNWKSNKQAVNIGDTLWFSADFLQQELQKSFQVDTLHMPDREFPGWKYKILQKTE